MRLSIVVPVYNVEKYILRCICSLLNQDYDEYEIIIVNDGTPDKSIEVIKDNCKDSRISIINQENKGLSAARNTGLANAKGDYIWFVDSDDWIEENCLSQIIRRIGETNADVVYVYADEIENERVYLRGRYNEIGVISGKEFLSKYKKYNCAPFYIVKRSLLTNHNIQFFNGLLHEDNDYTPRMLYYASRVTSIEGYLYHIFRHDGSITRTLNPKRLFDLIKIAENYKEYLEDIISEDWSYYCNVIGNSINQAMFECAKYPGDIQKEVNKKISDSRFGSYLLKSNIGKYKLEGVLFCLMPTKCLSIYKYMQIFNRDKGGLKSRGLVAK